MRVVVLVNNWLGWKSVAWLRERGEQIVGLVVHPAGKRRFGEEIAAAAGVAAEATFDGSTLRDPRVLRRLAALRPEVGLSVLFDYILKPELLALFPAGVLNLHPSYLPYNRGQYPNVWSIVEGSPAGVALHYIDAGVDTGDIVARRRVEIEPIDTGETLYRKLERAGLELLREGWPSVLDGTARRSAQDQAAGSVHRRRDVERIDRIDLDRRYTARELIDVLRARTFPPHRGAWFEADGRRIYLRLSLYYEEAATR